MRLPLKQVVDVGSAAKPITKDEFTQALRATLTASAKRLQYSGWFASDGHGQGKTGLAISGGADSMALAAMMRFYSDANDIASLTAFIVDHDLREESGKEAEQVQRVLQGKLGIRTEILRRDASHDISQQSFRKGETYARDLRFHLLEGALKRQGVDKILMAHHCNDQHETLLQRLAAGSRAGLTGIGSVSSLAMIGRSHLHNRPGSRASRFPSRTIDVLGPFEESKALQFQNNNGVFAMADPSPLILRPLLDFPKSRLVATCKYFGLDWVEDRTNYDPTFTARNAIRKISMAYKLPEALQLASIVSLQRTLRAASQRCEDEARRIFSLCKLQFDFRSGVLDVAFPLSEIEKCQQARQLARVGAELLKLCFQIVRPEGGIVELKDLTDIATTMFDSQAVLLAANTAIRVPRVQPFRTRLGVAFRPIAPSEQRFALKDVDNGQWSRWTFCRAGFKASDIQRAIESHEGPLACRLPLVHTPCNESEDLLGAYEERPQLWDGRFWVTAELRGIPKTSSGYLLVRPFVANDLDIMRKMCERQHLQLILHGIPVAGDKPGKQFDEILRSCAPGRIRYTLPVIEYVDEQQPTLSTVLALPTVGLSFRARQADNVGTNLPSILHVADHDGGNGFVSLHWSVWYKNFDIGDRRLAVRYVQDGRHPTWRLGIGASDTVVKK